MPAQSSAQQHTAQMARAVKHGHKRLRDMPAGARGAIRSMLGMSDSQLAEFSKKPKKGKA